MLIQNSHKHMAQYTNKALKSAGLKKGTGIEYSRIKNNRGKRRDISNVVLSALVLLKICSEELFTFAVVIKRYIYTPSSI